MLFWYFDNASSTAFACGIPPIASGISVANENTSVVNLFSSPYSSTIADFPIPDFRDIELKAVREYPYANITLFNSGQLEKAPTPIETTSVPSILSGIIMSPE